MASLVLEIQRDAVDGQTPASQLLRKALVAARKLRIGDFESWGRQELEGYADMDGIPKYRHLFGELRAFNPVRGWIPVAFPHKIMEKLQVRPLAQPLPGIEDVLREGGAFSLPFSPEMEALMWEWTEVQFKIRLHVSRGALVGIVEAVRDRVLNWALSLEERGIVGDDLSFTEREKELASTLVSGASSVVIHGDVIGGQVMSGSRDSEQRISNTHDPSAVSEFLRKLRSDVDALNLSADDAKSVRAEVATIDAQLQAPKPRNAVIAGGLASIQRILEGATGRVAAAYLLEAAQLLRHSF